MAETNNHSDKNFFLKYADSPRLEYARKERIKILLMRLGISQNQLADRIGVSRGTMSKIANGDWFPATSIMFKIAQELQVDSVIIFGDSRHWLNYLEKMVYKEEKC